MTDESFHLTPIDVRNQEFRTVFRGYEPAGVEEFRQRVAEELERLLRDKGLVDERNAGLREQLRAFREREKAMSEALTAAQEVRVQAERIAAAQVDEVVREAELKAERMLNEAWSAEADVRRDAHAGRRLVMGYLASFRATLERHLADLEALEAREKDEQNGPRSSGGLEIA